MKMADNEAPGISRKRSDDIVSLDSWNEAISTPESESPVDSFTFPNSPTQSGQDVTGNKHHGRKRSSGRRHPRSRSHSDKDRESVKTLDPLVLSPTPYMEQFVGSEAHAFESSRDQYCVYDKNKKENDSQRNEQDFKSNPIINCSPRSVNEHGKSSSQLGQSDNITDQRSGLSAPGKGSRTDVDGDLSNYGTNMYHRHRSKHSGRQQCSHHVKYSPQHKKHCDQCEHPDSHCEKCESQHYCDNQQQQKNCGRKVMSQSWQTQPHHYQPNHYPHSRHHLSRPYKWMGHERLANVLQYPSTATYPPSGITTPQLAQNEDDIDQSEKMKNKIMSVWNNVRYGWTLKTKTTFKCDSPIFLLGQCYHIRPSDDAPIPGDKKHLVPTVEKFKQDFSSQLWFTYRQDFPQIAGTKLTSDCGWGCMIRSGQMMVARAFVNHFLGRDWNVFRDQSVGEETYRKQIIRWFGDFPSEQSPFSIHRLVDIGKRLGKSPGDWYGPASVAHIMRDAMLKGYDLQPVLSDICIYVAQDSTVYKQDIYEMCSRRSRSTTKLSSSLESDTEKTKDTSPDESSDKDGEWKRAVIILVPIRLGSEEMNPVYGPCVKSLLAQDNCIGVIGGKPKHSLYFVGFQDDKLIYLDPHYCQDAVDTRERNFPVQSYHCLSPRKVALTKMDPSCTVGFYCKTKKEFETFVAQSEAMVSPPKQKLSYPMFVFSDGCGSELDLDSLSLEEDKLLRIRHVKMDQYGRIRSSTVDSEEFVVL